jgi:hypothetical protein
MDQTFEKVDLYLVVSGIMSFTFFFATPEIGSGIQILESALGILVVKARGRETEEGWPVEKAGPGPQ